MFRKIISPSVLLAAAPVAAKEVKAQDESNKPITHRPQDLPIYSTVFKNDNKRFGASINFIPFFFKYFPQFGLNDTNTFA